MNTSDFEYDLPEKFIAQEPLKDRDQCKLLVLDKKSGAVSHRQFRDIVNYFHAGDVLVLNDTKVIPARLFARKETGARIEVFLLREVGTGEWEVLMKPSRRVKEGQMLTFEGTDLSCCVVDAPNDRGVRQVRFMVAKDFSDKRHPQNDKKNDSHPEGSDFCDEGSQKEIDSYTFWEIIESIGSMPLPPYIKRTADTDDKETYQTIFADKRGAVAAPTAGLHFTEALLQALRQKGVEFVYVTLHVGYGTFRPVDVADIQEHTMHTEYFEVSDTAAAAINKAKDEGRRIVACGTTATRAVESAATKDGHLAAQKSKTDIFIYPSYTFKIVDALITNFHLPGSTLLMLVSALAGRENILNAYELAKQHDYRFFSYGDAMFIVETKDYRPKTVDQRPKTVDQRP